MSRARFVCISLFYLVNTSVLLSIAAPSRTQGLSLCDTSYGNPGNNIVQCKLKKEHFLDYKSVRLWTEKEQGKYSVRITCTGGGTVFMPWPFNAKNVQSLEVYGCSVQGFLSEMTLVPAFPHELKTLILSSVSIDLPLKSMVSLQTNIDKVPLKTDCGPTTLETMVLRDIHYDLKITPEDRDKVKKLKIGRNSDTKHATTKRCVYPSLKYIDESGSRKNGKYHLKLVPEYSEFPKLEVYNMSGNNLNHIPQGFKHLHSKKFPVLKYVDFTNNALKTFEFEFPKDLASCSLQMLDLRRNQITSMPTTAVQKLKELGTVLVDLRQNPLRCDCSNKIYKELIYQQFQTSKDIRKRTLLSDITCSQKDFQTGHVTERSLLNFTFNHDCLT